MTIKIELKKRFNERKLISIFRNIDLKAYVSLLITM